jgi:arylformamidase
MPKIYDVTAPLTADLPVYPGDPPFRLEPHQQIAAGDPYNLGRLSLSTQSGTHVDAPYHFLADGAAVDALPLEILMGKARLIELMGRDRIDRADLEALDLRDDLRVLLKTRMSGLMRQADFHADHVYLTEDAATYLAQAGIKLVGVDYLSFEKPGTTEYPAHHALLSAGVVIVEGLDLSEVEAGEYDLVCLPLRIPGADGAPARVVLRSRR